MDEVKLNFSYNLKEAKFELDPLQEEMINFYLRNDDSFRTAFYTDFTQPFFNYIKAKIKLKEPISLSVMGQVRCQPKGSKIFMANGEWKEIQNIKVGDEVISPQKDGTNEFSKVINVFNYKNVQTYSVRELNRKKKKLYSCSYNHVMPVNHLKMLRISKDRKASRLPKWEIQEYSVEKLSKLGDRQLNSNNLGISSYLIEKFKDIINCEIEPYCLGVYLGDGYFRKWNLGIANSNDEIINEFKKVYPCGSLVKRKAKTIKYSTVLRYSSIGSFANLLKKYKLFNKMSGDKFIPREALLSDSDYRKRLLAGLIDTDGYIKKSGSIVITTKSKQMAKDIYDLVYSLGGRASIRPISKAIKSINFRGNYFNVSLYIQFDLPMKNKFKLKRVCKTRAYLSSNRLSIKVRREKVQEVFGMEIDSESHYYITDNYMVTKNSGKSVGMISVTWLINYLHGKLMDGRYICSDAIDFLDKCKNLPTEDLLNSCFQIDEDKQAVFGSGSIAKKLKIEDVSNIIAINNLSTISICPTKFPRSASAQYGLRTLGRDFSGLNRFMLYNLQADDSTKKPLGMVYIPIFTRLLPPEIAMPLKKEYDDKKQLWVNQEMRGGNDTFSELKKRIALVFSKDPVYIEIKKKQEKLAYLMAKLGSEYTKAEIGEMFSLINLYIQGYMDE